jgi:hypothetical protein
VLDEVTGVGSFVDLTGHHTNSMLNPDVEEERCVVVLSLTLDSRCDGDARVLPIVAHKHLPAVLLRCTATKCQPVADFISAG